MSASRSPVGALLREWRNARGKSQLALAAHAGVSSRHLSFLETGRSSPSREMVLLLSEALEVPLRERNALLQAAGFTPMFAETPLEAPEMHQVRKALEALIRAHGPNPAVVVNRRCDILMSNEASQKLAAHLLAPDHLALATNMIRMVFSREGGRRYLENWREVAGEMLYRIRREHRGDADALVRELVGEGWEASDAGGEGPSWAPVTEVAQASVLLPVRVRHRGLKLDLFSTLTTLGTPNDVTLQELRVESLFPANAESERQLAALMVSEGLPSR